MSSRRSRSGGRADRKDVEPIEEIGPESPALHRGVEIPVGRRDDPHVHLDRGGPADPLELALLQHPEQLDLEIERQIADLVEEDGPAVGQLEPARPCG